MSTSYISFVRGATQENLREREVRSMTSYVATATPMRRNKTPIWLPNHVTRVAMVTAIWRHQ
jgi:hypothetical protein